MKKYRCPYCGEECISVIDKCFYIEWKKSLYGIKRGNRCLCCNNYFGIHNSCKWCANIFLFIAYCPVIISLVLGLFIPIFRIILIMYFFILELIISPFGTYLFYEITQYDQDKLKPYTLPPNAEIEISTDKIRIRNLSILGIKFNKKTDVVKFHETFTNDLVPVVFYTDNKKKKGKLKITIMKMEFIPKDLLSEGSEFTVIDNGKEITTGKIITVYEPKYI